MPRPTSNETPAEATTPGGLEFVSTTTRLHLGKDNRRELILQHATPFKLR